MSISLARLVLASLRRPERPEGDPGILRLLAGRPGIFDFISTTMQWRDSRTLAALPKQIHESDKYKDVYEYNLGRTLDKTITRTRRAERVIPILTLPRRSLRDERVLLIGPRNAHELLQIWLAGFSWRNIEAIDLYSTNKKIKVMNMEAMTHTSESFHALFSSATISYAKDVRQATSEFIRVLKIGGRGAFSHSQIHGPSEWSGNAVSGDQIATWIEELGGEVYYRHTWSKTIATDQPADIHDFGFVRRR